MRRDVRQGTGSFGVIATSVNRDLGSEALRSRLRSSAYAVGLTKDRRKITEVEPFRKLVREHGERRRGRARPDPVEFRALHEPARCDSHGIRSDRSLAQWPLRRLDLAKQTGRWQGNLRVTGITPGYEVNDLGFQTLADRIEVLSDVQYLKPTVGNHFRTFNVIASAANTFNFGGEAVVSDVGLSVNAEHASFNRFRGGITRRFEVWDDRLTRGGPLTLRPAGYSGDIGFNTDRRATLQFRTGFRFDEDDAGGWSRGGNVGLFLRFWENYEIDVGAQVSRDRFAAQYVATVSDPTATHTFGNRYLFAPLDQTTVSIDTRFNVTFSPDLTFELYAQPLMSSGDYRGLMELAAPRTFDFVRYGKDAGTLSRADSDGYMIDPGDGGEPFVVSDPDFDLRSLLGSAVLRWQWRPGSTLFLVWQQTRAERLVRTPGGAFDEGIGDFKLGRDARELFGLTRDNIFAIKVTYWLNP